MKALGRPRTFSSRDLYLFLFLLKKLPIDEKIESHNIKPPHISASHNTMSSDLPVSSIPVSLTEKIKEHGSLSNSTPKATAKGTPWKKDEDSRLIAAVKAGRSHKEIAVEHARSIGAIQSRIFKVAVEMANNGEPVHDVCSSMRVNHEDLEKWKMKYAGKSSARKQVNVMQQSTVTEASLLVEIRDVLLRIESHIMAASASNGR